MQNRRMRKTLLWLAVVVAFWISGAIFRQSVLGTILFLCGMAAFFALLFFGKTDRARQAREEDAPAQNASEPAAPLPDVRFSGTLSESTPKYATVIAAAKELERIGVTIRSIRTSGESSGHMGAIAFDRTYPSLDVFLQNVLTDAEKGQKGLALSWDRTWFEFTGASALRLSVWMEEDDGAQNPRQAFWRIDPDTQFGSDAEEEAERIARILEQYAPHDARSASAAQET